MPAVFRVGVDSGRVGLVVTDDVVRVPRLSVALLSVNENAEGIVALTVIWSLVMLPVA